MFFFLRYSAEWRMCSAEFTFEGYPRYSSRCLGVSMAEKREGYRLAKSLPKVLYAMTLI